MWKECKKCDHFTIKFDLDSITWEYSFYKFLSNFFISGPEARQSYCGHDFFKHSIFHFQIQNIFIDIEYFDNPVYELLPIDP
jgi:hypothetical protein